MGNPVTEILQRVRYIFALLTAEVESKPESTVIDVTPTTTTAFILNFVTGATHPDFSFAGLKSHASFVSIEGVDQDATLEYMLTGDKKFTKYPKGMKANAPVYIQDTQGKNTIKAIRITPDVASTRFIGNVHAGHAAIKGKGLKELLDAIGTSSSVGGGGGIPVLPS